MLRIAPSDVRAIVPKWTKRYHFIYFTSDRREAPAQIEALRLLKYRPLGGYVAPLALPELLDGAANQFDLLPWPNTNWFRASRQKLKYFVVNDKRARAVHDDASVVTAIVGGTECQWAGRVEADSVAYIGTIAVIPTESVVELTLASRGRPQR